MAEKRSNSFVMTPAIMEGVLALGLWFVCNIGLVIMNKYLISIMLFKFPLTLTSIHMLTCWMGSYLLLKVFPVQGFKFQPITTERHNKQVLPLALIFITGVVLGNISLMYIHVSFLQVIKSSVPAFTIGIETVFRTKVHSRDTYLAVVAVVAGVMMASLYEVNFNWIGFTTGILASMCTSSQAVVSGLLVSGEEKLSSANLVYYMSRISFYVLAPMALLTEYHGVMAYLRQADLSVMGPVLVLNGIAAHLLNMSTFYAIAKTSSLTYTVAGNFKVVLSVIISASIFHNDISLLNAVGCGITVAGVAAYNYVQMQKPSTSTKPKEIVEDEELGSLIVPNQVEDNADTRIGMDGGATLPKVASS